VTVGLEFRIPNHIWYVLYAITTLAAASIGCHAGLTGASRPLVVTAFVLIISAVMILIADIDGPRRVAFRVSQQVLVDLRRAMSKP
jgi:Mg2+/Co2+ transporter CorB